MEKHIIGGPRPVINTVSYRVIFEIGQVGVTLNALILVITTMENQRSKYIPFAFWNQAGLHMREQLLKRQFWLLIRKNLGLNKNSGTYCKISTLQ